METIQFEDVVKLNVGGKLMTTLLSTLRKEPDSMLAAMFSGRHVISKDTDGHYFIDCDGDVFKHILDFLRLGALPPPGISLDVYELARYFQIGSLAEKLEIFHPVKYQNQIAELRKQVDSRAYERLKQKAINGIEKLNVGPQEDKALYFYNQGMRSSCSSCYSNKEALEARDYTIYANIYFDTFNPPYLTDDMRVLLAHELCELGFAKYTATKNEKKLCNRCRAELEYHQIILLTH